MSIVISSNFGSLPEELYPTKLSLPPLTPNQAAELFTIMTKRQLKTDDVLQLILDDKSFPINDLNIGFNKIEDLLLSDETRIGKTTWGKLK